MKNIILLLCVTTIIVAQDKSSSLTGNLNLDKAVVMHETQNSDGSSNNGDILIHKKSPLLAGVMSFIVPGAGEFYSESYLKSGLFLAAEAIAITIAVINDNKGNDQTTVFQNYANQGWDVAKYARWTIDNIEHLNSKIGNDVNPGDFPNLFRDEERTKVNWEELNRLESAIGGWYSHRLEYFGEQQYYEMIGKYPQFNPGWDDFDESSLYTYTNAERNPVTKHFDYYSGLRGKANDYYNAASTAVAIVVVNHVLSAIDAAWTASRYNKAVSVSMSLEKEILGYYTDYHPQVNIKINF